MDNIVEAKGLCKSFGSLRAVDGIDLRVARGEVLGFLGPNGAGKSTTMRMLSGFLEPDAGSVHLCGVNLATNRQQALTNLGYLPEGAPAYPEMLVHEYLAFLAGVRGLYGAELRQRLAEVVEMVKLNTVFNQRVETLSKGFQRRLGLAGALLNSPPVLVLDEPTDGLDPNQKHEVRSLIRRLAPGKAIILSTHILEEVEAVCSRTVIINQGKVIFDGTPEELDQQAPNHVTSARLDWVFRQMTTGEVA